VKIAGGLSSPITAGVITLVGELLKEYDTSKHAERISKFSAICDGPFEMDQIIKATALELLKDGQGEQNKSGKKGNNAAGNVKAMFQAVLEGRVVKNPGNSQKTVAQLFKAASGKDLVVEVTGIKKREVIFVGEVNKDAEEVRSVRERMGLEGRRKSVIERQRPIYDEETLEEAMYVKFDRVFKLVDGDLQDSANKKKDIALLENNLRTCFGKEGLVQRPFATFFLKKIPGENNNMVPEQIMAELLLKSLGKAEIITKEGLIDIGKVGDPQVRNSNIRKVAENFREELMKLDKSHQASQTVEGRG
jgi:hypothetical protein